jgi:hypothetical protein
VCVYGFSRGFNKSTDTLLCYVKFPIRVGQLSVMKQLSYH